jgi:hypothetical protein
MNEGRKLLHLPVPEARSSTFTSFGFLPRRKAAMEGMICLRIASAVPTKRLSTFPIQHKVYIHHIEKAVIVNLVVVELCTVS